MLSIVDMHFSYKKKKLFQGIDLQVPQGKIIGLLGANGAGKSSLMKLICGLLSPDDGQINLLGGNPTKRTAESLSQLVFVFEDTIVPDMPQKTYLKLYSSFYPKFDEDLFWKIHQELQVEEGSLKKLSLGNKKKYLLSFALAARTPLLLMDEPTNGLDIPSKRLVRKILTTTLGEDQSMIVSTHQIRDLDQILDHYLFLHSGEILLSASREELTDSFIQVERDSPKGNEIYHEENPGGIKALICREEGAAEALDMEFFFEALIAEAGKIQNSLRRSE